MPKLSPAQQRVLTTLQERGVVHYSGRKAPTLKVLQALGLIELEYTVNPGIRYSTETYTARLIREPNRRES